MVTVVPAMWVCSGSASATVEFETGCLCRAGRRVSFHALQAGACRRRLSVDGLG
jgi:hypothetical protein